MDLRGELAAAQTVGAGRVETGDHRAGTAVEQGGAEELAAGGGARAEQDDARGEELPGPARTAPSVHGALREPEGHEHAHGDDAVDGVCPQEIQVAEATTGLSCHWMPAIRGARR